MRLPIWFRNMSKAENGLGKRVAVIPARGGSKRIPKKNIRLLQGKPILQWVIESADASGCFDSIVVSTDDPEIAAVARASGALVPFLRPAELSDDHTPTVPVIAHALKTLEQSGTSYETACCIYSTAVFASPEIIRNGLTLLQTGGCNYVISVIPYPHPIERALRLTPNSTIRMENPQHVATRSQDLQPSFHDAGQFYWGLSAAWVSGEPILSGRTKAVFLESAEARDIDNEQDWQIVEQLFSLRTNEASAMKVSKP